MQNHLKAFVGVVEHLSRAVHEVGLVFFQEYCSQSKPVLEWNICRPEVAVKREYIRKSMNIIAGTPTLQPTTTLLNKLLDICSTSPRAGPPKDELDYKLL
jgi:hypothetical protein